MKLSLFAFAICIVASLASNGNAELVFELNESVSYSHTTSSPNGFDSAGSQDLNFGTFSWGALATDGSLNTASFDGAGFAASDWGGTSKYKSNSIDVSSYDSMNIDFAGASKFNNSPTEFFNFFYVLDGGTEIEFGVSAGGNAGVSGALAGIDISAINAIQVGFEFNHNGSSDAASVSTLDVNVSSVPEPTSFLMFGMAAAGLGFRRRRA